jgi:hypothetical protein
MKDLCVLALLSLALALALAADPTPEWPIAFSSTLDLFRKSERRYFVARW